MRTPHPDPLPEVEGVPTTFPEARDASACPSGRDREERAGEGWVQATPREGWVQAAQRFVGRRAWLFSVLAIALLVGQLPSLLAMCCAPAGATGLGTVWSYALDVPALIGLVATGGMWIC